MRVVVAPEPGGPQILRLEERPYPLLGPGQALIRTSAAGVNFIDTYQRSGVYPMPFPHVVGGEGAGTVLEVGDGVDLTPGTPVGWVAGSGGSYADHVVVDTQHLIPLPNGLDARDAAAVLLQGMTAHYLVHDTFPVGAGQTVLVHAGAGGVGLLLTQMATARGAQVISTVSTAEKEDLAREAGATHVIRYDRLDDLTRDLPPAVRDAAGGGVDTVFDGVGRATFEASLTCLRPRGGLALFGGSSGQVPPVDPQRLNTGGSLFLTRPKLGDHIATRDELLTRGRAVLAAVHAGDLTVRIGGAYPLDRAADAHRDLEGRRTTGKLLLLP